jgi:hypothetical protein
MRRLTLIVGALVAFAPIARPAGDGFRELFNGRDLDGWAIDGPTEFKDKATGQTRPNWQVRDGHIVGAGAYGFLRYDRQQFGDFDFRVEYRLEKDGNSGLGIRTRVFDPKQSTATRPSFYSYEVQLLDDAGKPANKHCSGSLYRYVAPKEVAVKPSPEWNAVEVECAGPRIKVTINGKQVVDVDQTTVPEIKDKPLRGYVCLQSHSKQVEFRRVRIKEIKP